MGKKPGESYVKSWLMEPLAIATLSGLTPASIERAFYDDRLEVIPYDEPTDLVAISVETFTARRAYQIAAQYHRRGVPVVMGGFHATLAPEETGQHAEIVVIGEAETLWPQVIDDVAHGKAARQYKAARRPRLGGFRPDRSIYGHKPYLRLALVETGRGCCYACDFCSISSFFGGTYRARPVAEVVDEIQSIKIRNLFLVDDNLAVDRGRTVELLTALIPLRRRWVAQISLDAALDRSLPALMHQSGCRGVLIGLESMNPVALAAMGKTVNEQAHCYAEALNHLRRARLAVYATFVFGYDADGEESFRTAWEFARTNRLFFAAFNHLIPFPGTDLYERLRREGRLVSAAWWLSSAYRFGDVPFHPRGLTAEELARRCFQARREFYGVGSILRRAMDLRANCQSPLMALFYLVANVSSARDVWRRQGLPLGGDGGASM
ncbi:MAG: radical SAM protein [Planctomycetota bacterium]